MAFCKYRIKNEGFLYLYAKTEPKAPSIAISMKNCIRFKTS